VRPKEIPRPEASGLGMMNERQALGKSERWTSSSKQDYKPWQNLCKAGQGFSPDIRRQKKQGLQPLRPHGKEVLQQALINFLHA